MEKTENKQRRRSQGGGGIPPVNKAGEAGRPVFQWNRRIYDPRRWHKRSGSSSRSMSCGEPPAGWLLVWAGRFKRWKRRWFVAHPPGLLLYYKNAQQVGRPGCISLLGSTVVAIPGKDRQYKIVKGSVIYQLRTVTAEYRQAWIDAIHQSIHTYKKSLQKATIGTLPGGSLLSQQRIPAHVKGDLEEQKNELNKRLSERIREIEPFRQAFLQKLQALQESASVISSTLTFTNQVDSKNSNLSRMLHVVFSASGNGRNGENLDFLLSPSTEMGDRIAAQAQQDYLLQNRPYRQSVCSKNRGSDKRSGSFGSGSTMRRRISCGRNIAVGDSELGLRELGSCIGRDLFRWRRRDGNGSHQLQDRRLCAPEIVCTNFSDRSLPFSSIDQNMHGLLSKGRDERPNETSKGTVRHFCDASKENGFGCNNRNFGNHAVKSDKLCPTTSVNRGIQPDVDNPLHSAWNQMQDVFSKVLREEIHRGILLEAENALLQEFHSELPCIQEDRNNSLGTWERRESENPASEFNDSGRMNGKNAEDEQDGEKTDEEISCVSSDLTNEDYFEALEVLNQHEFIMKGTTSEDLQALGEEADCAQEPPEEGDLPGDADILSEAEGEEYDYPRTRLPAPKPLSRGFSLWTVLKNAVGKDLTHITMPATLNEPLSGLQRCAEEMQYRYLLEKASQMDDSIERLVWVSVFACATYCGSIHRDSKPFNPLLGETYEWQAPDNTARFISEQVCHHPPIMAFHAESTSGDYIFYGEIEIRNKIRGGKMEVLPAGVLHLRFPKYNDHYTWNKVPTCIHNVIVGKLWLDNYGDMLIKNHSTNEVGQIQFHKATSTEHGRISGKIFNASGMAQVSVYGNYMDKIFASPESCWDHCEANSFSRCIWEHPELPEDYQQQYCFTCFSISLNELKPELAAQLPPTDSRFRPDQRALEDGDLEKATLEKYRLEEKQREACKWRKEHCQEWKCIWFQQWEPKGIHVKELEDEDNEPSWVYNGEYWSAKEKQAFQHCPDIMGV